MTLNYEPGQRLRTIRLYGKLGARFGRVHVLAVNSAAEAFRALSVLLPGFEQFMFEAKDKGLAFAVFHGRRSITQDELGDPPGRSDIRIAPVIQGRKSGGLQTIAAIAIIVAASYFSGGAAAGGSSLFGSTTGTFFGTIGISMAFSGVAQMMTKTPAGLSSTDSADNAPSYSFNGPVNTQAQGNPVPLGYGRMIVGSAVGSAGIYAEDQS